MHDRDEDDEGGGAHQGRDQPLFQMIQKFHGGLSKNAGTLAPAQDAPVPLLQKDRMSLTAAPGGVASAITSRFPC